MQHIEKLTTFNNISWLEKYSRSLVFSVLAKIPNGVIEIVEGDKQYLFPDKVEGDCVQGKIYIHHSSVYRDFVRGGSIGAAQAYIDGKWSSPDLTSLIRLFAQVQQHIDGIERQRSWLNKCKNKIFHWKNRNSQLGSKRNILAHYDLGNELYSRFLDKKMMYSCAIYSDKCSSLETAQDNKLAKICQRLALKDSDHLLEIGSGWGGFAIYAAKHYHCKVTTTTISDAQYEYAKQEITRQGLDNKITLLKKDYRELSGKYDKLVSIEMIEAVGYEFLSGFVEVCHNRLKSGGKMLIQSITIADQRFEYYKKNVDFIQRYIFPGGFLPSISVLTEKMTKHTSFVVDSIDDIGLDYAKTLADWREAFLSSWSELTSFGYDEQFKRLWLYYFAYCEGAFLARSTSAIHLVARKSTD